MAKTKNSNGRNNSHAIGLSGEFLVAAEIAKRGWEVVHTSHGHPGYDLFAHKSGHVVGIRVKAASDTTIKWTASDQVDFTAWLSFPWTDWISTSGRFAVRWWSNYGGDELRAPPPPTIPTARPDLRGGTAFDLLGGINVIVPLGVLGKHRLAIEAGGPVEQWLDGPQLETDWKLVVGWQLAF